MRTNSVGITRIHSLRLLAQAFEALRTFQPMGKEEIAFLLARTAETAKEGKFEIDKTSTMYDASARRQWGQFFILYKYLKNGIVVLCLDR